MEFKRNENIIILMNYEKMKRSVGWGVFNKSKYCRINGDIIKSNLSRWKMVWGCEVFEIVIVKTVHFVVLILVTF